MKDDFAGDKKNLTHFLVRYERMLIDAFVPYVPFWMSTAHLTLMTLLWAVLIVICGYFANGNIVWLWGFNAFILLQYITDMLDGEVGRRRNTGLIKWGFYMDHFLDYVFLCAILIGYSFCLPPSFSFLALLCLAVSGGFMNHALMDFAITNDFKISFNRFGISEVRIILILINVLTIIFGKTFLIAIFPVIVASSLIALVVLVYKSQQTYSRIDHEAIKNGN